MSNYRWVRLADGTRALLGCFGNEGRYLTAKVLQVEGADANTLARPGMRVCRLLFGQWREDLVTSHAEGAK